MVILQLRNRIMDVSGTDHDTWPNADEDGNQVLNLG
jgi:hypothetical protein